MLLNHRRSSCVESGAILALRSSGGIHKLTAVLTEWCTADAMHQWCRAWRGSKNASPQPWLAAGYVSPCQYLMIAMLLAYTIQCVSVTCPRNACSARLQVYSCLRGKHMPRTHLMAQWWNVEHCSDACTVQYVMAADLSMRMRQWGF